MKELELQQLSEYDGKDGNAVYVAYKGKIYDVSKSKLWKTGLHMNRHRAGKDMSTDLQAAPHGPEMLERFPEVGLLKEGIKREIPESLNRLLIRIPMLRRHPHPMTVHFPIVFMFATTVFNVLYLITGLRSFELTALHSLGAGLLFTPVAILTGVYTWWLNYEQRPMRAVTVKKRVSMLLFGLQILLFVWRLRVPRVLDSLQGVGVVYLFLTLALLPLVTVIGWFGASLTFPLKED